MGAFLEKNHTKVTININITIIIFLFIYLFTVYDLIYFFSYQLVYDNKYLVKSHPHTSF